MSKLITSASNLFEKLSQDYSEFKQNKYSAFKALDVALAGWHLTDWVYNEYERSKYSGDIGKMREEFYKTCPELRTMHDLATGYKHMTISHPKDKHLTDSNAQWLDLVGRNGDPDGLKITREGVDVELDVLFEKVVDFWLYYFQEKHYEEQEQIENNRSEEEREQIENSRLDE